MDTVSEVSEFWESWESAEEYLQIAIWKASGQPDHERIRHYGEFFDKIDQLYKSDPGIAREYFLARLNYKDPKIVGGFVQLVMGELGFWPKEITGHPRVLALKGERVFELPVPKSESMQSNEETSEELKKCAERIVKASRGVVTVSEGSQLIAIQQKILEHLRMQERNRQNG